MPPHQAKPFTSSHQARPRTSTTLTPHISAARGSVADRVLRPRSQTARAYQLSKREQQAFLDAVTVSGASQLHQGQSSISSTGDLGDPTLHPEQIYPGPAILTPVSIASLTTPEAGQTAESLAHTLVAGEKDYLTDDLEGQNMSATAYMLPTFGHMDPFSSSYQSAYQTGAAASYVSEDSQAVPRSSPPAAAYSATYAVSPRQSHQRPAARPHRGSYASSYQSTSSDPYLSHAGAGSGSYGYTNPASHLASYPSTLNSHEIASAAYGTSYSVSNPTYNTSNFDSQFPAVQSTPSGYISAQSAANYPSPRGYGAASSADATPGTPEDGGVRILNSRPKPQCWDHGCNGRQFSTFSNLLRHQREKSGTAAKSVCPRCGAEFTRTTARNGHMAHDKCKRKSSTTSASGAE